MILRGRVLDREEALSIDMKSSRTAMMLPPSIEECRLAAVKEGMPEREGDKFYAHFEKVGWVCGKGRLPMKSFAGAMMGWRLHWEEQGKVGAPTAELNGKHHNAPLSDAMLIFKGKEYERVIERLRKLGEGFFPAYKGEQAALRKRRDELRKELGIVI